MSNYQRVALGPREQLQNPQRRSAGESLQSRLHASSFPHRVFADIGKRLIDAMSCPDIDCDETYATLLEEESGLGPFDYIRYVELQRDNGAIYLSVKRLKVEEMEGHIRDTRDTHEELLSVRFDTAGLPVLQDTAELTQYLLSVFYVTVTPRRYQKDIPAVNWRCDDRSQNSARRVPTNITTAEVVSMLEASFGKHQFHVALSTRGIQVFDQEKVISAR